MSLETFKSQLDDVVKNGRVIDFGVPINRTNALPLDLSSIIILGDPSINDYETDTNFKVLAGSAAIADPNSYPGQIKTVIGKVAGQIKAISLVLQADGASVKVLAYQDSVDALAQDLEEEVNKTNSIQANVTELQKQISNFDDKFTEIDDLHATIGNLTSIMNFRGVFKEFSLATTENLTPLEHGDVIVISREPDYTFKVKDTSINGMEYIWNAETSRWVELGFGSNIALFIGGNAGLTVPQKLLCGQYDHTYTDLISYYNAALTKLVNLIGLIPDETKDTVSFKVKLDEDAPVILGAENLVDYLSRYLTAENDALHAELNAELAKKTSEIENNLDKTLVEAKAELSEAISDTEDRLGDSIENIQRTINEETNFFSADKSIYSQVIFQDDLTLTHQFGKYAPDATGRFILHTKGKNIQEILLDAFTQEKYTDLIVTSPTASFTVVSGSSRGEAGATHSKPKVKLNLNMSGSYLYGAKNSENELVSTANISATKAEIYYQNDELELVSQMDPDSPNADLVYELELGANDLKYSDGTTTYKFYGYATSGEDANRPLTNLGNFIGEDVEGNNFGTEDFSQATGHILAKVLLDGNEISISYTGYRKMFMGAVAEEPESVDSAFIKELTGVSAEAAFGSKEFKALAGDKSFYIAIPAALTSKMPTFEYKLYGSWKALSGVQDLGEINVEGANNYNAVPYKVYKYTPATGSFDAKETEIRVTII